MFGLTAALHGNITPVRGQGHLGNTLFALTGKRQRSLPLRADA